MFRRARHLLAGMAVMSVTVVVAAGCGSTSSSTSSGTAKKTSAAGTTSASTNGSPFRILFIGDFSGPTKFYGALEYEGLETAAAYWNQRGGLDGHQIVLTKEDDGASPATAVNDLLKYVSTHPKPDWVYAGTLSNELSALIPVLKRDDILGGGLGDTSNVCANAPSNCPTAFFEGPREQQDAGAAAPI